MVLIGYKIPPPQPKFVTGVTFRGSNQLPTSDNVSSNLSGGRASATLPSFADGQDPTSVDRILRDIWTPTGAGPHP